MLVNSSSHNRNRGASAWMGWIERWLLFNRKHDGISVNGKHCLTAKNSFLHSIVVGSTGSGKTSTYIYPTLYNLVNHGHSIVLMDPSSEIRHTTQGYLKKQGYQIKVLDPNNADVSDQFNPLLRITKDIEITRLAQNLMSGQTSNNSFWIDSGTDLLVLLIYILKERGSRFCNLRHLEQVLLMSSGSEEDQQKVLKWAARLPVRQYAKYKSIINQSPETLLSIYATVRAALSGVSENILNITDTDTIAIEEIRKTKTAVFINIPENEQNLYGYFSTIFYNAVFDELFKMPEPNQPYNHVFILADEFANTKLPSERITTVLSTMRRRSVSISLIIQSMSQLDSIYGHHDASTIFGNTNTKIFLPGLDDLSCERISRLLGKGGRKKGSVSNLLIDPEELRMLEDDYLIVLHRNKQPALMRRYPYFKNRRIMNAFNS